ncbi:MAG: DNA repair protein rad52 [Thelocarpon impressellum]|nr:MAG: DNA repair protein rad52 [Thelocarpon impressellum]
MATANPFDEPQRRVSGFTAQEIATLSSRLEKQLGPEYISSRPGAAGQKVHYLAAEKSINLANEVFGFNGWSSGIQNVQIDFVDENATTGKVSLGLSVIVRVTLKDGTFHEDIGYGHIENCKGKAAAFEKAKKEGTTDALKRALRNFGNVLGNCIYDKDYLARITKVKVEPSRWAVENLHRHQDYAPVKREATEVDRERERQVGPLAETKNASASASASTVTLDDEFGGDDLDEVDFAEPHVPEGGNPDEVMLDVGSVRADNSNGSVGPDQGQGPQTRRSVPQPHTPGPTSRSSTSMRPPQVHPANPHTRPIADQAPPGFYTARAAPLLQNVDNPPLANAPTFNPHAESPSIRKTSGIDHSKSKPVNRDALGIPSPAAVAAAPRGPSFVSPQLDGARRIGMPGAAATSPMQNRSSYKPPGPAAAAGAQKRGADAALGTNNSSAALTSNNAHHHAASRVPLADKPADRVNMPVGSGGCGGTGDGETKRQRLADL